jgi:nucleoside-diphosphate-sugar epimerase
MARHAVVEEDLQNILHTPLSWGEFHGRAVLVTGANGILPAYVVETLLYLNERRTGAPVRVLALVRDRRRAEARFTHYRGRDDLRFLVQDIGRPVPDDVQADFIIHAASPARPQEFATDPVGTLVPNVVGTYHLLELARRCGVRGFLFLSSGEVYGRTPDGQATISETDFGPLDPTVVRSCYGEGKRAGEALCAAYAHQYRVPTRIARLGHSYGPGMRLDDGRVFADFVADVVHRRPIVLKSDGSAVRPFCYLSDAVVGCFTVLLNGADGQAYTVANDDAYVSVRELAELIVGLFPERRLSVVYAGEPAGANPTVGPARFGRVDTSKVRTLGWRPTVGPAEGFRRTVLSYETASFAQP